MKQLSGRRIVLTGASRGIGRESVEVLAREGAEIIGVARNEAKLAELGAQFPSFHGLTGDITDKALGPRIAEAVQRRWGALDVLVNNAAVQNYNAGFHDEPLDTLEQNLATNVLGAHWLTHALLPLLLAGKEPRIVNVSS